MTTQTEITQRNHHRAVRFFWGLLIGATTVSLIGNIAHAVLPYLPPIVIQIGAAAVPPIALLAAVHGIALAVRAGASGRVYCWAVSATALIGVGAFAVSFLALRDLMLAIGYSSATAWVFPAIIDTAVAVSTLMLVALGDKPARRTRTAIAPPVHNVRRCSGRRRVQNPRSCRSAPSECVAQTAQAEREQGLASVQPDPAQTVQLSASRGDTGRCRPCIRSDCIGVTTQSVDTVVAVLSAHRDGASINAAAKASGINYRTAQRIVEAAAERRQRQLVAAS